MAHGRRMQKRKVCPENRHDAFSVTMSCLHLLQPWSTIMHTLGSTLPNMFLRLVFLHRSLTFSRLVLPQGQSGAVSSGKAADCTQVHMDEYEVIKCINFIRTNVSQGRDPRSELAGAVSTPEKPWKDDTYLMPVLPDDAMLFHDFGSPMESLPVSSSRSVNLTCRQCCTSA